MENTHSLHKQLQYHAGEADRIRDKLARMDINEAVGLRDMAAQAVDHRAQRC